MSENARKSGRRVVALRERVNSVATWDDATVADRSTVFVPVGDAETVLDHMEVCIERHRLTKLEHIFLDGGVMVRFRSQREADLFRQALLRLDE